jgi:hypothetical protein
MSPKQPLPEGPRSARTRPATKRAWEHGQYMPASRTPDTTRTRSIDRSLRREPGAAPAKPKAAPKAPPSAKTRRGRGGQRKDRRGGTRRR